MTPVFHRAMYTQIALTLTSLEPLGLLQTSYIEDLAGVDGQLSLVLPGGEVREVLLTGLDAAHERFRAFIPLGGLPDGGYRVRGRARDVVGNEAAFDFAFEIEAGLGTVVQVPGLSVVGVLSVAPALLAARPTALPGRALSVSPLPLAARAAAAPERALSAGLPLPPPPHGRTLPARSY